MTDPDFAPDLLPVAVPRFCPRCGLGTRADDEATLCESCGEVLANRGYCPTCEDFWKLSPGSPCPKHEVELIDSPPPVSVPGQRSRLVTVATYSHPVQANAPRIRLEAEGIPTFLDGERVAGNTLYQVATGGVRLMVPADLASTARILISQTWAPIAGDDDLEDAWDDLAPDPGTRRRAAMKAAIIVILFGPLILYVGQFLAVAFHWFGW